jgi:hypothetical protein
MTLNSIANCRKGSSTGYPQLVEFNGSNGSSADRRASEMRPQAYRLSETGV